MADFIEKNLPKNVRDKIQTLIAAALGLFLGLRYNDYVKKLIEQFLPANMTILQEGIVLIIITFGIVYLSIFIQKGLDGR